MGVRMGSHPATTRVQNWGWLTAVGLVDWLVVASAALVCQEREGVFDWLTTWLGWLIGWMLGLLGWKPLVQELGSPLVLAQI